MTLHSIFILGAAAILAYLTGAVPFGYLIAGARGIDIRTVGSGNIGATNVFRSVSKKLGLLTFMLDVLKGFLPAFALPLIARSVFAFDSRPYLGLVCACAAVAGHNWPIYLGFKGGKGVATSAGALLGIVPAATGIGLLAWIAVFLTTRYVSVASMLAAIAMVVCSWIIYIERGAVLPVVLTLLGLLVVWRHKGNILRLLAGTESRIEFGRKKDAGQTP